MVEIPEARHTAPSVLVMCMMGRGHIQRLVPVINGLSDRGLDVQVMAPAGYADKVAVAGGTFADIYARRSLEEVQDTSFPPAARLATFTANHAESLISDAAALRPSLLVYDSASVAAPVIARHLDIPYVSVRAGHAQVPSRVIAEMNAHPRIEISRQCKKAVERLRHELRMPEASPLSYLDGMSPYLNLYCEPPEFLKDEDRAAFEPIEFFGSLEPELSEHESTQRPLQHANRALRVLMNFGSMFDHARYESVSDAVEVILGAFSEYDAEILVSLKKDTMDRKPLSRLLKPGVRIEPWTDQWGALKDADLFVTHHGLNSTHEAIYHGIPMLSCPIFSDQPAMARRCQDFGLALPLTESVEEQLDPVKVQSVINEALENYDSINTRLAEARSWEITVMADRDRVLDRMLNLI